MLIAKQYIAVVDVGHGNSTILHDNNDNVIIDCGQGSSLLEFLTKEEITNIDTIILSHADIDHIGGLINLIASSLFSIGSVYINSDSTKNTKSWDDLLYELSLSQTIKLRTGITIDTPPFTCGSIVLKVAGPSGYLSGKSPGSTDHSGKKITSNSISSSFHVLWKDISVAYLAGDIDQVSLEDLIKHKINLNSPLLVFPHHGGKNSNSDIVKFTEHLCELTQSSTVIFSIGRRKHANPRPEVIKKLKECIPDVRIACTQLSKHCSIDLPSSTPQHLVDAFSQGKSQQECCSGTFIIKLDRQVEHWPTVDSHRKFIALSAPTALCN